MSNQHTIPSVGEVKAQIQAGDQKIEAAKERKRLLTKQLKLSQEMSKLTEPNGSTTTERIVESDSQ